MFNQPGLLLSIKSIISLLKAVAGQLAGVIANAGLSATVDSLNDDLIALGAMTEVVSSVTLKLDERLRRIADETQSAFGVEGVLIHLLSEQDASLTRSAGTLGNADSLMAQAESLARQALDSGQIATLISSDQSDDRRFLLSLPIFSEAQVVGTFTLLGHPGYVFQDDDQRRLKMFARQVVAAVQVTTKLEAIQSQKQLDETLNAVARVIGSRLNLDEVLESILNALQEIIAYTSVSIMLLEGGDLKIASSRDVRFNAAKHPEIEWQQLPSFQNLMAHRRPQVVPDTSQYSLWQEVVDTDNVKSWIGVPLISRGRLIGVLNINSDKTGAYRPEDGNRLASFANQIATVLDNAILYQQAEAQQAEARALYDATRVMVSSSDVTDIVEQVLEKIGRVIPFDVGTLLRVVDDESDMTFDIIIQTTSDNEQIRSAARQSVIDGYTVLSDNLVNRSTAQNDLQSSGTDSEGDALPSQLSVPLLLGNRLLGIIELSSVTPGAYTEADLRMLFTIANPLATALENAALLDTLQVRANNLEEAYRELAARDRMRNELIQTVSHELRTPMTFITGYVDLLINGEFGSLNEGSIA